MNTIETDARIFYNLHWSWHEEKKKTLKKEFTCECDSVSAPSAFGKHELVWGRGGYAVTNLRSQLLWVRSTALPETARGGEGGEDTAHGRTLRSIMAPIGLKAVVGESKIIMLILLGYWGLMFNHMYVLFYATLPLHVSWVFLSVQFPLDAAGCFPAIVLNGEDITLGMLRMRIVHQWSMTWIGFIPIACCLNYKYMAREPD